MIGFMSGLKDSLERAGFQVSEKQVKYASLVGETVSERKVTGFKPTEKVKVSYVESGGSGKLYITVQGSRASKRLASVLEGLGGSVDYDDSEDRIFAVFKKINEEKASSIVRRVFGIGGSRLG